MTVSTLALTCFVLLGAGYAVFFLLGRVERLAPVIREAWPILHMEALIVGVVAGAFWLGGSVLSVALLLHAGRTAWEAAKVNGLRGKSLPPLAFAAGLMALSWAAAFLPLSILCLIALIALVSGLINHAVLRILNWQNLTVPVDLILFPGIPLVIFTAAGLQGGVGVWLLAAFILVETFDSYALLGGKLFGEHKAFPNLSPNKTIEGLALGAVMLVLTAAAVGALLGGVPVPALAGIALVAGLLTVAGDLSASRLKRLCGVKDYPRILPHQGGLLDITDAWIAAGAGLVCLATLLGVA